MWGAQAPQQGLAGSTGGGFAGGGGNAFPTQPVAPAFGQAFGQPAGGFAFGAQQQQPQPAGGFAFQQPAGTFPAPAPASGLSAAAQPFAAFGQQQQQQVPTAGGFAFGQQQPAFGGFGAGSGDGAAASNAAAAPAAGTFPFGQQQPASSAAAPANTFLFGQPAPAATPAPSQFTFGQGSAAQPQAPVQQQQQDGGGGGGVRLAFGSAQRKKPTAAAAFAEDEGDMQEVDEAALAAAKAAALASLPKFGGGPPPPPPPRGMRRSGGSAAAGLDAEEVARRAQRASRFGDLPASGRESPAPQAPAPQRPPPANAWAREGSAAPEGDMGGGEGEEEDEGGVRAGAIVGTCEEMCPPVERERRSRLSDIQIFERLDHANSSQTSPELAVKRFARTIDDSNNAPEFFRTRGALARTMAHLRALLDRGGARLGLVHKFLWDRYRSVRQDLYIQGMDDEFAVGLFEEIVRFHVLSEHELCEEEASITEMEGFNSHLNMEQMNKALISINDMYNKLAAAGRPAQHEAEFRAYHLLSLMGQHGKFKGDQQGFLSMLQAMRADVRGSSAIQWVLQLQRAFASNNFVRFFALVRRAPYLLACLSHIYFGQIRGRALRTLGDTLAPKADTPVPLELSWLVDALMLDSLEDARQLCAMHGYETGVVQGVPAVLLVKGAYVDPPPPVPRKTSRLITGMAPATRSLAVTTPSVPPMSPEEAAALEQQRQQQLQRLREQEAARAQQAAEQQRQQEQAGAAAAAAADRERQAAEAARLAHEAQLREQQLEQQRQQQLEEQQRNQAALEEQRRRQEEEAWRQRQQEEQRRQQEAMQRAAEEAERQRREAEEAERRRREAAEAAERRRLAELERQRLEELRRLEEERRARREAKRRWAMQRFYLARWRLETRRRIEERQRLERLAVNLKACRVGMATKASAAGYTSDFVALSDSSEPPAGLPSWDAAAAARRAIDLPALAAPLLLQRSPAAHTLYWKLLLAPPPVLHASSLLWGPDQQRLQHLHGWLTLQLHCGRPCATASCCTYVEGPLPLRLGGGNGGPAAETVAELATCVACPDTGTQHCGSAALAGASGIVLALPSGRGGHRELQQRLPLPSSMAARLPILLVAATDAAAQHWEQEIGGNRLALTGPVKVVSVQGEAAPGSPGQVAAASGGAQAEAASTAYSRQRLVQGLRWLAAHSPPQPPLKVAAVEALARDALAAMCTPLRRLPAVHAGGLAAAQLLCGALARALTLVEQVAERSSSSATAAWQWPPPEVAPPALRTWHDGGTLRALRSALERLRPTPDSLLHLADGQSQQALTVALHMQLAALEAAALPPLVLPPDVEQWLEGQLDAARVAAPPVLPHPQLLAAVQQQVQQLPDSPSRRQKRKHEPGSSPPAQVFRKVATEAGTAAPVAQRSWAAIVAGGAPSARAQAPPAAPAPAISGLPLWEQLKQRLDAEKAQAAGLHDAALHVATGNNVAPAPVQAAWQQHQQPALANGAAGGKPSLLQTLRAAASAERTANEWLVRLAHQ